MNKEPNASLFLIDFSKVEIFLTFNVFHLYHQKIHKDLRCTIQNIQNKKLFWRQTNKPEVILQPLKSKMHVLFVRFGMNVQLES